MTVANDQLAVVPRYRDSEAGGGPKGGDDLPEGCHRHPVELA
jgi:hypothetical protein